MRHRTRNLYPTTAVYNAQVKTFGVALHFVGIDWKLLRVRPKYRDESARTARRETAKAVLAIRRAKGTFPAPSQFGVASAIPVLAMQS